MTDTLSLEDRLALVEYRLLRARNTLEEADYNAAGGYYNTAVNRLYYACYYAASALLLKNEIVCGTHAGVKTQFSLRFVKTGLMDKRHGVTLHMLFENRQSSDYDDFVYCDEELYDTLRPRVSEFIDAVCEVIKL